jgi:hypothetical protein
MSAAIRTEKSQAVLVDWLNMVTPPVVKAADGEKSFLLLIRQSTGRIGRNGKAQREIRGARSSSLVDLRRFREHHCQALIILPCASLRAETKNTKTQNLAFL